jgi:DnaJ homolog subfamily C member 7
MPPAVAPDPPRENPIGPEPAAAFMASPRLGLGLTPPGADLSSAAPPPAPPSRRAPRLSKRRHAAAASRSRAPRSPAGTWNPFSGGGSSDGTAQDGNDGALSGDDGGAGFEKAQTGGFVFGAVPAASQQPPEPVAAASPSEAPFVFGSVRESLPPFEDGWSASSKLPDKMGNLNPGNPLEAGAAFFQREDQKDGSSVIGVAISGLVPNSEVHVLPEKLTQLNVGSGVPLQSDSANAVPKTFVFGGNAAEYSASSRNTAAVGDHSFVSTSVLGTDARTVPEMSMQFSIGNQAPSGWMRSEHSDGAPTAFIFGGTARSVNTDNTKNDYIGANLSSSNTANGSDDANVLPEKLTHLNIGSDIPLHCMKTGASHQPEVFTFGSGGVAGAGSSKETGTASERSSEFLSANSNISSLCSDFLSTADSKHSSSANRAENLLPEKTSDLNAGDEVMLQSMKSDNANYPSKALKFNIGCGIPSQNSLDETATRPPEAFVFGTNVPSFSSAQTASTSFTHFQANVSTQPKDKGGNVTNEYTSNLTYSEANSEQGYGPNTFVFGSGNASACTEGATEYALHEEIKKVNISMEAIPSESCAVKQDLPGCSREALFGLENIRSAYRGKKEVHKNKTKNKRPTRLKQNAQFHQVVYQETCSNGETSDLAGEYSPMDCSPYPAAPEHASTEAHVFDSSISKENSSCAEDDLVSATEHLVIDADIPTFRDEGRVPNFDESQGNFGGSFSSFEGLTNASHYSFTSVNIGTNVEINTVTTEINADGDRCNVSGQACDGKTYRTLPEFGEAVGFQSSSSNFSGLNFSFGASSSPQRLLSAQRRNTRRKLQTKDGPASKPSTTHAFVQPKSSQDTKAMEIFPEASKNRDWTNEQPASGASASTSLETCETWRTRFV